MILLFLIYDIWFALILKMCIVSLNEKLMQQEY